MTKPQKHPDDSKFYCGARRCRKSAWQTPEYLTEDDWKNTRDAVSALKADDLPTFNRILRRPGFHEVFFNRVIAWPEGARYYTQSSNPRTYFKSMQSSELPRLLIALAEHDKQMGLPRVSPPQPDRLHAAPAVQQAQRLMKVKQSTPRHRPPTSIPK